MCQRILWLVPTKSDAFWNYVHEYCEESNRGLMKRRVDVMKKRWHRINYGAQQFGGCYDQASRNIGSGSNNDDITVFAHKLYFTKHKKKCNFVRYWNQLQREQKWKTQSIDSEGSKRTKISAFEAYLSLSNPEMVTGEDVGVESPVHPQGTKASKRKGKGKSKACEGGLTLEEKIGTLKSATVKKLSLMEDFKSMEERELALKEKVAVKAQEMTIKEMEMVT